MSVNVPNKIPVPFADAGLKNTIPANSDNVNGLAGYDQGFPPINMTPKTAGGIPPFGQDMNGILFAITEALRFSQAGSTFVYDSAFATAIGGYRVGALVQRTDGNGFWLNLTDGNVTDPESAGAAAAGWVPEFTYGISAVTMTNANVTLTPLQYGKPIIVITGALTGNLNLIFPNIADQWIIINNASGSFSITCKTLAGTGIVAPQSSSTSIVCDGSNIYFSSNAVSSTGLNGQCRLSKSGTNLLLSPFNGNKLIINNFSQTIPSAGVSLSPAGLISLTSTTTRSIASNIATLGHAALASAIPVGTIILVKDIGGAAAYNGLKVVTASTTTSTSYAAVAANEASTADTSGRILPCYYIYAYMNSGVMALEASTVGHSADSASGAEIKTGDATRSLVGMAALVSGAFVDTTTQHFVLSWFNQASFVLRNNFTANRTTSSSTAIEINPEIRIEFLSFSGDCLKISAVGSAAVSSGGGGSNGEGFVMLDGTTSANTLPGTSNQLQVPGNGGGIQLHSFAIQRSMTEGAHFVTMGGDVGGGSSITFTGGANPNAYQLYVGN